MAAFARFVVVVVVVVIIVVVWFGFVLELSPFQLKTSRITTQNKNTKIWVFKLHVC